MGQYIEKIVWPDCWSQQMIKLRCMTILSCPPRQRHRLPGGSKMTCGRPRPELRSRRDITTCHRSVRWWRHGHCIKHVTSLQVTYYIMLMVVYIDIASTFLHPFYVKWYNMTTPTPPTVDGGMDIASNMLPGYDVTNMLPGCNVTMSSVTTCHRECVRQTAKHWWWCTIPGRCIK